jgi:AcrR family transcriptional regulator
MTPPNAGMTARERARAELTREIKESARRQLAKAGANGLSLRAISRELGMVSSALYRYFPSRDDLLTALIIDAYDSIGSEVEAAIAAVPADSAAGTGEAEEGSVGSARVRERWLAAGRAVRAWAREHPHEYALLYGSPVPGYRAPEATIGPASRVPFALIGLLRDRGITAPSQAAAAPPDIEMPDALREQTAVVLAALADGVNSPGNLPPDLLVRGVIAWTQLFGMVSFELFGQFVGSFDPTDAFFENAVAEMATLVGL